MRRGGGGSLSGAAVLVALAATLAWAGPDGPGKRELGELKQQLGAAVQEGRWRDVPPLFARLGTSSDKAVWKVLIKVAEQAPARSGVAEALRDAAVAQPDRKVGEELRRAAVKSRSAEVRRLLLALMAERQEWEPLLEAIEDKDEQVASLAVWRLAEHRVEAALEPMMAAMDKLDRGHEGIWDVLRDALARLLGQRCNSAVEYRSLWKIVQERGGLAQVQPAPITGDAPAAGGSAVRLFGREVECTRVVFILDTSGSMEAKDPDQADPLEGTTGTVAPGAGGGRTLLTRLERAKRALIQVIERLPANVKLNLVAYDSNVRIWKAEQGDDPASLHELTPAVREEAKAWVENLNCQGTTATDMALQRAFTVDGARCFYLLSDGFATRDGTNRIETADILAIIDQNQRDRHVTIHTMGFTGADRDMMETVARHTGGRYSDIR